MLAGTKDGEQACDAGLQPELACHALQRLRARQLRSAIQRGGRTFGRLAEDSSGRPVLQRRADVHEAHAPPVVVRHLGQDPCQRLHQAMVEQVGGVFLALGAIHAVAGQIEDDRRPQRREPVSDRLQVTEVAAHDHRPDRVARELFRRLHRAHRAHHLRPLRTKRARDPMADEARGAEDEGTTVAIRGRSLVHTLRATTAMVGAT